MSEVHLIIDDIKTGMKELLPHRLITRTWQDREKYHKKQREQGVHCVLYRGEHSENDPYQGMIKLLVYGLIELPGREATGEKVEAAEHQLIEELKQFSQSDTGGLLQIRNIVTSMQVETPCGWYVAECEYGPVDLSVIDNRWDDGTDGPDDVLVGLYPKVGEDHQDDYFPVEDQEGKNAN